MRKVPIPEGAKLCPISDFDREMMEAPEKRRLAQEEQKASLLKRAREFPLGYRTGSDQNLIYELVGRVEELEKLLKEQAQQ
jgi:hypothetical protein